MLPVQMHSKQFFSRANFHNVVAFAFPNFNSALNVEDSAGKMLGDFYFSPSCLASSLVPTERENAKGIADRPSNRRIDKSGTVPDWPHRLASSCPGPKFGQSNAGQTGDLDS